MTTGADAPLSPQRDLFELPEEVLYLNCATMAPQLRAVGEAGVEAMRRLRAPWRLRPADWFTGADAVRAAAARLMGADAEGVAIVPAVSYGIAVAAANLPVARGQNVVVLDDQFPSNVYAWRELAATRGAELRTVRREPLAAWTEGVLAAVDDATAVVAVPNCHWTDGTLVDLAAVGERARAVGAAFVVDASQSLGAYPLDVGALRPDFLVSVGYKWQLGPYGLAYLYVDERRRDGRPLEASWMTRANAEDFTGLVRYVDEYRPGARRFDMGEASHFVLGPMALAALEQLHEWGVPRIQATLGRLTARIAEGAATLGCEVVPSAHRVGHMLGVRLPGGASRETLARHLEEERIHVGLRGDAIRVAPHLHNEDGDAERLLAVLSEAL